MTTRNLRRFEGRLFAESGQLFMVVDADQISGTARVSCQIEGQPTVIDMRYADVVRRIGASAGLVLDNLNSPESARRLVQEADGWHFTSREGTMGPFPSKAEAARQLGRYVLRMQVEAPQQAEQTPSAPAASHGVSTPRRRRSDQTQSSSQAA